MTIGTLWEKQPDALSFAHLHTCQYEPIFPCWTSVLGERPSLNCVFTIYTWKAGLYSSSRPEARKTQRNTTVGKILISKRSYHLKTPDKEPAMKHTISEELQQSSSWMNKKLGHTEVCRCAHLNNLLPLRPKSIQTTHSLLWQEGMTTYSLPSTTFSKSFAFSYSLHFCACEQRKTV